MAQEEVTFPGSRGAQLSGVLHHPEGTARGSILMAHCFTCSKDLHTMSRLSRGLAEAGYAVLRFDFTGLGNSGGRFSETTVSSNVGDLARAAMTLIQRGFGPCGLVGHSLGGAAGLLAAHKLKTVRSIAVVGAPSSPTHVRRLLGEAELKIRREGETVATIAGREFPISEEFLADLDAHDTAAHVTQLGRPLLILHAVDDEIVGVDQGEALFAAARQPKAFVPLLGTDHLLSDRPSAERALHMLVDWFGHTL
ncbi:MAG: alpha/beta hydrolase family protein [Actinomycetota bacterium]